MDIYTEEGKIISSEIVLPEDGEKGEKPRHLSGFFGLLEKVLLIAIPISGVIFALDFFISFKVVIYKQQYMSIFLGLVLASIFLGKPANRGARNRLPWYDIVLAGMSLGIGIFCCVVYPHYLITGIGYVGLGYPVLGVLTTLLVIEASRRVTGWILVVLAVMCIFYALFTWLLPSPFYGRGTSWDELSVYFFMDSNGILGIPLWVTSSMIFGFILFGEFLSSMGGALIINEFALATVGKFRGGPAKVSVISSGLFGTVSGSVVANVVVDGWITIPLMKKTGYEPEVAAAIEATASTGGQLMPPVMGAAAFLMAEFLSIPYAEVAIAALVPAIIYYYALFLQVDMEAGKKGLKGVPGRTPPIWPILKKSWIVSFPLVVLVYTLFILDFQPGKSAIAGVTSMIIIGFLTKETRLGFHKFLNILEKTGRGILMIGAVTALAGIIVGGIFISGASTALTITLVNLAGLNLFLMLIITAILCIILGMGMATAGVYLILGVIMAPSLVQIGVVPLAAHLFIFYFGLMSMVTPCMFCCLRRSCHCEYQYSENRISRGSSWLRRLHRCIPLCIFT